MYVDQFIQSFSLGKINHRPPSATIYFLHSLHPNILFIYEILVQGEWEVQIDQLTRNYEIKYVLSL